MTRIEVPIPHIQYVKRACDVTGFRRFRRIVAGVVLLIIEYLVFGTQELSIVILHAVFDPAVSSESNSELKLKLKSIDVEDERRREKSVVDMDNYYKNKLNDIQTELVCFAKIIN